MTERWTWHGGGLSAARAHFGEHQDGWLDLSTGINPHAWPAALTVAIDWRGLPDETELRTLEEAAAGHFRCDPAYVCAVPGTEVGLRLCGEFLPAPARHVTPTYRTHGEMLAGSVAIAIDEVAKADASTLIIANPNNPDGRLLDHQTLIDLLARRDFGSAAQSWLVIDESFADCHPDNSLANIVDDSRRLIIFRSFGKFFGLAGLRLGFVLAPRAFIARLRHKLGAWPVSAAAIAIGTAAYRDLEWIRHTRERVASEASELEQVLHARGYVVRGKCPLYRLIECKTAHPLFEHLAKRAILTRPFRENPRWLRVGLPGSRGAFCRFIAALPDHG